MVWLLLTKIDCRPQWTLTFWVNETFSGSFQHNSMSNDQTKIEPRLFYNVEWDFFCGFQTGGPLVRVEGAIYFDSTLFLDDVMAGMHD